MSRPGRASVRIAVHALLSVALVPGLVALGVASPAAAHEEREATFPDGSGERPTFLGWDNPRQRVVCTSRSAHRIEEMPAGRVKERNEQLLEACEFRSIQSAINSIERRGTSVYILPGRYHETRWAELERSSYCANLDSAAADPAVGSQYIGSVTSGQVPSAGPGEGDEETASDPISLTYGDQRRCPHNLNLIAVFGDETPDNKSIACDSELCGTQLVGTGRRKTDVIIDNRFAKLNAIRADRAGGILMRNFTVQQAEFNSIYVLETDGFVLERLITRGNDEYGILAFASDHGLIQRTDNYYNGDSGIYPGSGSDLNADNQELEATRYAIEIRNNKSHDNTLGYSGTAGNSIWAHHNDFYDNSTGIATDSLFPGHPGLPQDHARWDHNRIYSNNENYYTRYVDQGVCEKPIEERGYLNGTVCPVIPTPVGTGILIAGGNFNSTDHNWIYDNWRYGTMQFWVPAALRDEYDPTLQNDTSHNNHTTDNLMGITPDGEILHNGLDHWWDDQGDGNCWEDNTYSRGEQTDNFAIPPAACADGGSSFTPGLPVKDAGFVSCSQYDRNDPDFRHPPACEWFDDPSNPEESEASSLSGAGVASEQDTEALVAAPLVSLAGLLLLLGLARRRHGAA